MVKFAFDYLEYSEYTEENMEAPGVHIPVMPDEVREGLNLSAGAVYVDGTTGCGGHARMICSALKGDVRLIGIDRDRSSLDVARAQLADYQDRVTLVHDDFRNIDRVLSGLAISQADGILLDVGISSFQLDNPERGFSHRSDGPLDMRMDQESFISAYDLINSLSEREISLILKNYGEERFHHRIAHFLVSRRPIQSTQELSDIVLQAMPARFHHQRIHPATRTFQAFRIAVNRELEALEIALDKAANLLKPGGRMCVISFHSLEDRIVKLKFRALARDGQAELVTKKPLRPTEEEIQRNPRSRSARLRVLKKV